MAQVTPKARTGEELKDLLNYTNQTKLTQEDSTVIIPNWIYSL